MPYVLIASIITLFFAFTLGVFFLTLLKVSGPVPVPDMRHVAPRPQARDIPAREGRSRQIGRPVSRRTHASSPTHSAPLEPPPPAPATTCPAGWPGGIPPRSGVGSRP
jgi:hypothetical protein